jgi:TonB-dependent SusC/RagA subfamily outer membrane receptor
MKTGNLEIQKVSFNCSSHSRCLNPDFQPLLIIDKKVIPVAQLSTLNPDVIVSINILKGENALFLYGARAKDGVIIITTKCTVPGTPFL